MTLKDNNTERAENFFPFSPQFATSIKSRQGPIRMLRHSSLGFLQYSASNHVIRFPSPLNYTRSSEWSLWFHLIGLVDISIGEQIYYAYIQNALTWSRALLTSMPIKGPSIDRELHPRLGLRNLTRFPLSMVPG
jgi:hypothetical protein